MSKLILPQHFSARDRLPPKAEFGARLEGRVRWQLVGRDGKVKKEGEQSNLVLDSGLNHVAQYGFLGVEAYAVVGTGSTAPAVGQSALIAELGRTASTGGVSIPTPLTAVSNGVFSYQVVREFDFAVANGNLTEWGFSPGSSSTTLFCRALFRDGSNNPITVTKTSSEKLRLYYTLTVTFTPIVATAANFTLTGLGAKTGMFCTTGGFSSQNALQIFDRIVQASSSARCGVADRRYAASYSLGSVFPLAAAKAPTFSSFIAGTWERTVTMAFPTAEANIVHETWGIGSQTNGSSGLYYPGGYLFTFDVGQEFTKDNLHSLTVDLFKITWGR